METSYFLVVGGLMWVVILLALFLAVRPVFRWFKRQLEAQNVAVALLLAGGLAAAVYVTRIFVH
jgi:Kef-type K+ transport system membrane component KefB